MKNSIVKVCALGLALMSVFTCSSCNLFNYGDKQDPVELHTAAPVAYSMYKVIKSDLEVSYTGFATVESLGIVKYFFEDGEMPYLIKHINVKPGDYVNKGDLLVEGIDSLGNECSLFALNSGYVRYVNDEHFENHDEVASVMPYELIVTVDSEDVEKAAIAVKISRIEDGGEIENGTVFSFTADNGEVFQGAVEGCSYEELRNVYYVGMHNATQELAIGDRISYKYTVDSAKDCLVVPVETIHEYRGRKFVYVLDERGLRRECYVRLGIDDGFFVQIVSGLEEGDLIIKD